MDRKSERIGTFKEFCKSKSQDKGLNETNGVNLKVDWWDQCIVEVMQDLDDEVLGIFAWINILEFCKSKCLILGREMPGCDADIILEHIKDLIFYHHGSSFVNGSTVGDNTDIHSKGLAIENLAQVILDKVREKTDTEDEMQDEDSTTHLVDYDTTKLVPAKEVPADDKYENEYCEDLPWEYDCENKKIVSFDKFSSMLEESQMVLGNYGKCENVVLGKIATEVGSLKLDDILKFLKKSGKKQKLYDYLYDTTMAVLDKMGKMTIEYKGKEVKTEGGVNDFVLKAAQKLHCNMIVDDVLKDINQCSGVSDEKVE